MRKYPHKPDEGSLREALQWCLGQYKGTMEGTKAALLERKVSFFKMGCEEVLELAYITYAFEEPLQQVRQHLNVACGLAERAVELGTKLDPVLYVKYLSLAIICRQEGFRKMLEGLQRHQYTNTNIEADEIFYMAAEAMAALSADKADTARDITARALARARSKEVDKLARAVMEPVLMLEAAIADRDAHGLASAVKAQHERHRANYSPKSARNAPSGLLDVRTVGMLALARKHGLPADPSNVYTPLELLSEETA